MRQSQGKKTKHKGIYQLSDGSFRIVAKVKDPKTGKPMFIERLTREIDDQKRPTDVNAAVAYRAQLIDKVKKGASGSGVPTEIPRLVDLCHDSSWITFLVSGCARKRTAVEIGREIDKQIIPRWGDYFINRIEIAEIDVWVREMEKKYAPRTVRECAGILKRVLAKARGQWHLPPLDWSLITLPKVTDEHAKQNRLPVDEIVKALQVVKSEYSWYAPMIFTMYSTGLRYCHVAAMRWAKLNANGVVTLTESYDYKTKTFAPITARKNAPCEVQLEPYTLELVREHRKRLMAENHPGLQSGLLFPSVRGDLPVGNDQANDVWREAQAKAGLDKLISIHGIRHTFHDVARKQGVDSATVKAMAGHSTDARHFLYSQGVDIEEVGQASQRVVGAFLARSGNDGPPVGTDTEKAMDVFRAHMKSLRKAKQKSRDAGRDGSTTGDVGDKKTATGDAG